MPATNLTKDPNFGYWFYPSDSNHAPAGNRLDICLRESPTEEHYDPQSVHLAVRTRADSVEILKITHPWSFEKSYQVCAGLVEIIDRKGKKEEAFTFGGHLNIETVKDLTICSIKSPAPVLEITGAKPTREIFIEEVEILIAERKAALLTEKHDFEQRLVNADPLKLYIVILNSIMEKFEHSHHKEDLLINQLNQFLHNESRRLEDQGMKPYLMPAVKDIL